VVNEDDAVARRAGVDFKIRNGSEAGVLECGWGVLKLGKSTQTVTENLAVK
jgi:hypothetical protein